jgi:SHAQKYF class myb-like DNA-binding protein
MTEHSKQTPTEGCPPNDSTDKPLISCGAPESPASLERSAPNTASMEGVEAESVPPTGTTTSAYSGTDSTHSSIPCDTDICGGPMRHFATTADEPTASSNRNIGDLHDDDAVCLRSAHKEVSSGGRMGQAPTRTNETAPKHHRAQPKRAAADRSAGRWTAAEHQVFLRGLSTYGREWKKVAAHIPTRTSAQVRSHAQKYFCRLQRHDDVDTSNHSNEDTTTTTTNTVTNNNNTTIGKSVSVHTAASADDNTDSGSQTGGYVSASVRAQAERILADPEAVQSQVPALARTTPPTTL